MFREIPCALQRYSLTRNLRTYRNLFKEGRNSIRKDTSFTFLTPIYQRFEAEGSRLQIIYFGPNVIFLVFLLVVNLVLLRYNDPGDVYRDGWYRFWWKSNPKLKVSGVRTIVTRKKWKENKGKDREKRKERRKEKMIETKTMSCLLKKNTFISYLSKMTEGHTRLISKFVVKVS